MLKLEGAWRAASRICSRSPREISTGSKTLTALLCKIASRIPLIEPPCCHYNIQVLRMQHKKQRSGSDCAWITGKPEVIPINSTAPLLPADSMLVARVPKDGGVQLRLACRKRDKGRQ